MSKCTETIFYFDGVPELTTFNNFKVQSIVQCKHNTKFGVFADTTQDSTVSVLIAEFNAKEQAEVFRDMCSIVSARYK